MKKIKITYWIFTGLICAFDGLLPALTFNSELAKEGIRHLGYPDYFRVALTVFKICGAIILILPVFKGRIKEWAYAGFMFNFVWATISTIAVDGFGLQVIVPLIAIVIISISYYCYHQLHPALQVKQ